MKWDILCVTLISMLVPMTIAQTTISIIPEPVSVQSELGFFELTQKTVIITDQHTQKLGEQFSEMLAPATGFKHAVKAANRGQKNVILLALNPQREDLGKEGYKLTVNSNQIWIEAADKAGLFYGIQTLRQLLPTEIYKQSVVEGVEWVIPCVTIEDMPRFKWRGLHLDVARHFMPKAFVKKYIDLLALHKMNTFHWHLTEDQGWRIEIKKYPKLIEVGAWRKETVIGKNSGKYNGKRHGGFYTQEDVREIVAYAKERYITVVPEIEMPGHCRATLAAYPELSCTGGPFEVKTNWGVEPEVYCAGNDTVLQFQKDVLTEVLALFPSEYIHIGGDECPKSRWEKCPKCQTRIRAEGLKDEHELQSWFVKQIDTFLAGKGRRLVGWDEILEGGLAPGSTVMSWRGEAGGIRAAKAGHDVVMAPNSHTYFDYYQAERKTEPLAIGGFLPLEKVYSYDPIPAVLTAEEGKHVLGAQGQLWTEYMPNGGHVEYMAFPRACALAEVVWTLAENKDYKTFYSRLLTHAKRLKNLEVNFRPLDPPRRTVGNWKSGQTSEDYKPMTWDLTSHLEGSGAYILTFNYTSGEHRLDIRSLEILEDGTVVDQDEHLGITGGRNENNTYKVKIPEYKKTAKYALRAVIRSDGGADSNGKIFLVKQ
ncbi:MAG: beta-N-acetylhexosaminidase [Planctomycetota bacterium]